MRLCELKRKAAEIENNIEEMELFLWLNKNVNEIKLEDVITYYEELKEAGYVRIKDILIYKEGVSLKQFTEDSLDEILDNENQVDKLFDKDDIIEMWIEGTTKEEVKRDLISTENYILLLAINPKIVYKSVNGDTIMYAELEF